MEAWTFTPGVLAGHESVKGYAVLASDGRAGRVSWACYAPGDSYLVVTSGRLRRAHRIVPAGAVVNVRDREVVLTLSRADVRDLPDLPHPQAFVGDAAASDAVSIFNRVAGPQTM